MSEFFHLVLAGNIGAGKTTVTGLLSERFGWRAYYERVAENPFLEPFYGNMERWAFALQIYFLTHRLGDHRAIEERRESAIQDRSIHEDALIFARNLHEMGMMGDGEWESYLALYRQVVALLRPPDLVVYLRRDVDSLCRNIHLRGRDYEASMPRDYLKRLNRYYEDWIASRGHERVLLVESDDLDFVDRPADLELLVRQVQSAMGQRELFAADDAPPDLRFRLLAP